MPQISLLPVNGTTSASVMCPEANGISMNSSTNNTSSSTGLSQHELAFLINGGSLTIGVNMSQCFSVNTSLDVSHPLAVKLRRMLVWAVAQAHAVATLPLPLMAAGSSVANFSLSVTPMAVECFGYGAWSNVTMIGALVTFSGAVCAAPPAVPQPSSVSAAQTAGKAGQVAVVAAVDPVMAAQAVRAGLSLALVVCAASPDPIGALYSPTGLALGHSDAMYYVGAAIGNMLLLCGFALAQIAIAALIRAVQPSRSWEDAFAIVRFPSLTVFPLMYLQQTTIAAGVTTIMSAEPGYLGVGVLAIILPSLPLPLAFLCVLRKSRFCCTYVDHDRSRGEGGVLVYFFFGPGRWINNSDLPAKDAEGHERTQGGLQFKQRFQFLFTDYIPQGRCFMLGEMTMNILCGIFQGLISPTYCKSLLFASVVVFGAFASAGLYIRPFASLFYGIFSVGQSVLQLISCALSMMAVVTGSSVMIDYAAYSNALCMYALILQAVVGLWPKVSKMRRWWMRLRGIDPSSAVGVHVVSSSLSSTPVLPVMAGRDEAVCEASPCGAVMEAATAAGRGAATTPSVELETVVSMDSLDEFLRSSPAHQQLGSISDDGRRNGAASPVPDPGQPFDMLHATEMADMDFSPLLTAKISSKVAEVELEENDFDL